MINLTFQFDFILKQIFNTAPVAQKILLILKVIKSDLKMVEIQTWVMNLQEFLLREVCPPE